MLFLVRTLRCWKCVSGASRAFLSSIAHAQSAAPGPNTDPTYLALRTLGLSGEAVSVSNLELKRDAGTFHLRSGTVCFVAPVAGKVTGAVFAGDGNFILDPPASERDMLKLLTKENEFSENFSQMVLRFTDSTYDEIKKAGVAGASGLRRRAVERQPAHHPAQAQEQSRVADSGRRVECGAGRAVCRVHPRQALRRAGTLLDRSASRTANRSIS